MENIYFFFLLVSLTASISGKENGTTQNGIATTLHPENNLTRTIFTATFKLNENENKNNELKNEGSEKIVLVAAEKSEVNKNVSLKVVTRKSRDIEHKDGIECLSCSGSGISSSDEKCYRGAPVKKQKCAEIEQCFTELHPQYIKRGCTLPLSINRTFVCKCPLCNDKPSGDLTYYEYTSIRDWEYDNKRLEVPVAGIDLLCKTCETKGINTAADRSCKLGKSADYMQCTSNQLCFININLQVDFVSRGCINKPVYNSIYYFCNESRCNDKTFPNSRKKRSEIVFRTIPLVRKTSSVSSIFITKIIFIVAISINCVNLLHE